MDQETSPMKLHDLPDKGGKLRVIAIGNCWIQFSLCRLHSLSMKILESIKFDFAFKQDNAIKYLKGLKGPKFSYDLKSATDRFPIQLQTMVVEKL